MYIPIDNNFKRKWTKCSNQKTEWLNGYKNKIHIYVVCKRLTSDLKHRQTESETIVKDIKIKWK